MPRTAHILQCANFLFQKSNSFRHLASFLLTVFNIQVTNRACMQVFHRPLRFRAPRGFEWCPVKTGQVPKARENQGRSTRPPIVAVGIAQTVVAVQVEQTKVGTVVAVVAESLAPAAIVD